MSESVKELVQRALDNDCLTDLITGINGYAWAPDRDFPVDLPTDIAYVIRNGLYPVYREGHHSDIPDRFREAVEDLLKGTPEEVWYAYNFCWNELFFELGKKAPFVIVNYMWYREELRKAFRSRKEELSKSFVLVGEFEKEGLWGQMMRSNLGMKARFGVSLL